jgi:hypothetical protein
MWMNEVWAWNFESIVADIRKGEHSEPVPVPLCPSQAPRDLAWDWIQATAGKSRRPSAWAITPLIDKYQRSTLERIWRSCVHCLVSGLRLTLVFWKGCAFQKNGSVSAVTTQHLVSSVTDLTGEVFTLFAWTWKQTRYVRNVLRAKHSIKDEAQKPSEILGLVKWIKMWNRQGLDSLPNL